MNTKPEVIEVTFSAGDWSYPIYFSQNSAGYWETYHVTTYSDPKASLNDAISRFIEYLKSEWNLPDAQIEHATPKPVSVETAKRNNPGELSERSGGKFNRAPKL